MRAYKTHIPHRIYKTIDTYHNLSRVREKHAICQMVKHLDIGIFVHL